MVCAYGQTLENFSGSAIDLQELIEEIADHAASRDQYSLDYIISIPSSYRRIEEIQGVACEELSDVKIQYSTLLDESSDKQKSYMLLEACVREIKAYVYRGTTTENSVEGSRSLLHALQCGYTTPQLLKLYTIAVVIQGVESVKGDQRFICANDESSVSNENLEWGISQISREYLYYFDVLNSRSLVSDYIKYKDSVLSNRELESCTYIQELGLQDRFKDGENSINLDC